MFNPEHVRDTFRTTGLYFTNCKKFSSSSRGTPELEKLSFLKK